MIYRVIYHPRTILLALLVLLLVVAAEGPIEAHEGHGGHKASGVKRVKAGGAPPAGSGPISVTGPVRVIDGDTLEVDINGSRVGVDLIGVDTPQGNTRCGKLATAQLQAMVADGVRLEEEPNLTFDQRGLRLYKAVEPSNRSSVAKKLVRAGVAKVDKKGKESAELAKAQGQAKATKRGCLWDGPAKKNGGSASPETGDAGILTNGLAMLGQTLQQGATWLSGMWDLLPDGLQGFLGARPADAQSGGGFASETVVAGLNNPTAFTFLPDGRALIAEKNGVVRVQKNGQVLPTPFIDIRGQVNDYWDRGLLGITADANFENNGYVYLLFTYENSPASYDGTKTARLIRITANGDTADPATETVILGQASGRFLQELSSRVRLHPLRLLFALHRQRQGDSRWHPVSDGRRRSKLQHSERRRPESPRSELPSVAR